MLIWFLFFVLALSSPAKPICDLFGIETNFHEYVALHDQTKDSHSISPHDERHCYVPRKTPCLAQETQDFDLSIFQPTSFFQPAWVAVDRLQTLYASFLQKANNRWQALQPMTSFWTKRSKVELFSDPVNIPTDCRVNIPWSLVSKFATQILSGTKLGVIKPHELAHTSDAPDTLINMVDVELRVSDPRLGLTAKSLALVRRETNKTTSLVASTEPAIAKRNKIKLVHFKQFQYILPASIAVPWIREFFDAIVEDSTNYWPIALQPLALFTVTTGPFQLTFSCLGSRIPWAVITSAARRFSLLANRNFPCTFDAYYEDPETSITMMISLRLVGNLLLQMPVPRDLHKRGIETIPSTA